MKKLPYIEDYIVLMSEHVLSWPIREPVIKLARYDEPIVESMNGQIASNTGFTDKQSVLAHKIVIKYRRQWASAGYDVGHLIDTPKYRLPIRTIDRRKRIVLEDSYIAISFPYDQDLISHIRAGVAQVPGSLYFDRDSRQWRAGITEQRLIWVKEFGLKFNFDFDQAFNNAIEQLLSQPDYKISLVNDGAGYKITNAADSMLEYLHQRTEFVKENYLKLCDYSSILGYNIDSDIAQQLNTELDPKVISLLTNREVNLTYANRATIDIGPIIEYAHLVNRFPIYVYEVNDKIILEKLKDYFDHSEICMFKANSELDPGAQVIYCNQWKLTDVRIPLLITMHTLMIGYKRQQMLQNSEKIVYFTQHIE